MASVRLQTTTVRGLLVFCLVAAFLLVGEGAVFSNILYVRGSGSRALTNGLSWATAFVKVQQALNVASAGDEIWVSAGLYRENLTLKDGVALFGGFAGDESARSQRNWNVHESILDGGTLGRVVTAIGEGAATRLDGFVLRNGSADFGAGIYVAGSNFIAANNLIISNNATGIFGGGGAFLDQVAPRFEGGDALSIFTNMAASLLSPKVPNGIQLFPTNEYTAAVHQRFQVAANLADAVHNGASKFPLVFRPVFSNSGGTISISGWTEATDAAFVSNQWLDLKLSSDRLLLLDDVTRSNVNIHGQPVVLSAKKHLPNFNEFSMETVVDVIRKVLIRKPNANPMTLPNETNEMYMLSVTNVFGVETWNPYTQTIAGPVELHVSHTISATIDTHSGWRVWPSGEEQVTSTASMLVTNWSGVSLQIPTGTNAFKIPYEKTVAMLPLSQLVFGVRQQFQPGTTNDFDRRPGFFLPDLVLNMTNRLQYLAIQAGRVVDCVTLDGLESRIDLTGETFWDSPDPFDSPDDMFWNTNRIGGTSASMPTEGLLRQIETSLGEWYLESRIWDDFNLGGSIDYRNQVDQFRVFLGMSPIFSTRSFTLTNRMQVPFSPMRKIYHRSSWQANDPLVHFTVSDLQPMVVKQFVIPPKRSYSMFSQSNIGRLNERFEPFYRRSGNPLHDPYQFRAQSRSEYAPDATLQDPDVYWPEDWNFPRNGLTHLDALNRVHRGTAWQTLYASSQYAQSETWSQWSGSPETHPTNDWAIFRTFVESGVEGSGGAVLVNNTIGGNRTGIAIAGTATLVNNIVAGNGSGIEGVAPGNVTLSRNLVSGNAGLDYSHLSPGATDLAGDPQFVSSRNWRLSATSPAVDAGNGSVFGASLLFNDPARVHGAALDIGAYEGSSDDAPLVKLVHRPEQPNSLRIQVLGFGENYELQRSEDLQNWSSVGTGATAEGMFETADTLNQTNVFYRAIRVP